MDNKDQLNMFKAVVNSSIVDFEDAFSKAISNKVSERLRDKEISVSSSLLNKLEQEQEGDEDDQANS